MIFCCCSCAFVEWEGVLFELEDFMKDLSRICFKEIQDVLVDEDYLISVLFEYDYAVYFD